MDMKAYIFVHEPKGMNGPKSYHVSYGHQQASGNDIRPTGLPGVPTTPTDLSRLLEADVLDKPLRILRGGHDGPIEEGNIRSLVNGMEIDDFHYSGIRQKSRPLNSRELSELSDEVTRALVHYL